ncbi:MAG: ArnT family glycosyltransferase [Planctomycetota bacterium]
MTFVGMRLHWSLLALPMLVSAAVRGLWAPDEPRYAQVAREAWEGSGFLVLHLCGSVYADKPPLVYWLAGACGAATGWQEWALRLPSLAATLGTAWLVARFAERAWGRTEAALAPVAYLTMALVVEMGGRLQLDPALTFLCTASLYLATDGGRFGASTRQILAGGLCLGLAALAKGPVAWSNFGLVLGAWAVAERRPPRFRAAQWGFVGLALLPVAAWATSAMLAEPALREELLYRQHVGRMTAAISHPGPPWEPLVELAALSMPWTPLWLILAFQALRSRRAQTVDHGLRRSLAWIGVLLVFFSVIAEKRNVYLLPAYPAVALVAARALALLAAGQANPTLRRAAFLAPALLTLVGLAACFAFVAAPTVLEKMPEATQIGLRGLGLGLPVAALGLATLRALGSGRTDLYAGRLAATMAALALAVGLFVYPLVDLRKSAEGLARVLAARPENPAAIPCYGVQPEGYRFYSGRPTVNDATGALLEAAAADGEQPFLALVTEARLGELSEATRARVEIAHREQVGSRSVLLLTRR